MVPEDTRYTFGCAVCGEMYYRVTGEQLTNLRAFHAAGHAAQHGDDCAAVRLGLLERTVEHFEAAEKWYEGDSYFGNSPELAALRQLKREIDAELGQ